MFHVYQLPDGYMDEDGDVHKEVEIASLTGREEEIVAVSDKECMASLVSLVLASCIKKIGPFTDITEDFVRGLTIGDRQFLIMKLRELTFGEQIDATLSCPWSDCGEQVDIDFSISDIPVKHHESAQHVYKMQLDAGLMYGIQEKDKNVELVFRLPNGADQELLSSVFQNDEDEAQTQLLWRCVVKLGEKNKPALDEIRELPALAKKEIEKAIESACPSLELNMNAACPECGRKFTAPFDLQEFFFDEFLTSQSELYREVHYLAYYYHWSEHEIMDLSRDKRRQYIGLLSEEIERMNNAFA